MTTLKVDGCGVFAVRGGGAPGSGRPSVVLLHGAGMDHGAWAQQCRALVRRGYAVLAPDLPGHGRSDGPPLAVIEALSDWLIGLLDAAGIERAALAGHSLAALVALDAAARHASRVRALALLGAAARMPVHPALLAAARDDLPKAIGFVDQWSRGRSSDDGAAPSGPLRPALTRIGQRLLRLARPGALAAGLAACNDYGDGEARAAVVRCATVVIAGECDRMTPATAGRALADAIPAATFAEIADAGHMLHLDHPRPTLDALLTTV